MITPTIEKAILNGWGTLINFSVGFSSVAKIKIPKNHFGIITDFKYYPYNKFQGLQDIDVLSYWEQDMLQEVCFYVNGRSHKWTFRPSFTISQTAPNSHFLNPTKEMHVDTFIVADTDVFIQFKNPQMLANMSGTVTDFSFLRDPQIPVNPETAYTFTQVTKSLQSVYGDKYAFPDYDEAGVTPQAGFTSTTVNAQSLNEITNFANPTQYNYQNPLLNVSVLMVSEQNRSRLQSI